MKNGNFVISLDFELMWGVLDKKSIKEYGENIENVWEVIPTMLSLFSKYNVKATFSTVGMLFLKSKQDLIDITPKIQPNYSNRNLSPYKSKNYAYISEAIINSKYFFASKLIKKILVNGNHEIGTHTYSHYYCLENKQSIEEFESDIQTAVEVMNRFQIKPTSIVFPRNQVNEEYLAICKKYGIISYRGIEDSKVFKKSSNKVFNIFQRTIRLTDRYINITGHHSYDLDEINNDVEITNIPSSRFLAPYSKRLHFLEKLRLRRIKKGMSYAAKNGLTYHLWWHPHNFGSNTKENFEFLESILDHYEMLNTKFSFSSKTMSDLIIK